MNVSRQLTTTASEDAVSMYLSFEDSESNISFKSTQDAKNENEEHGTDDSKGNSTLEPQDDEEFCNTMKDLSNVLAPLRPQSLNVLREFISSTPSKMGDNLDNNAGVGTNLRRSLRLKENVSIHLANMNSKTETSLVGDKENIPNIQQHTNRKNVSIESENCQKTEETLSEEKKEDTENSSNLSEKIMTPVSLKCQTTESKSYEIKQQKEITNLNFPITSSSKIQLKKSTYENENQMNKVGSFFNKSVDISKSKTVQKKEKMHSIVRLSLCEPDLEKNRPSRIVPKKTTRYSSVNPSDAVNVARAAWPALSRAKFSISKDGKKLEQIKEEVTLSQKSTNHAVRKSINPSQKPTIVGRKSVLPSATNGAQRIPTVVKTTLNSSIRKAAPRRSVADTMNSATSRRRSVLLLQNKLGSPMAARKKVSYRPSSTTTSSDEAMQRSKPNRAAGGGILTNKSTYNAKSEIKLICSDCGASYNTKAQLETHKRTHLKAIQEIKKTRALGLSSNNGIFAVSNASNNRCKYCDKTFAIERALHIHLLEHCPKIPAIERRKLNYDDMDHVVKPEIPHFRQATKDLGNAGVDPLINLPVKTNADKIETNFKSLRSKIENILKKDEPSEQSAKSQMGPPISTKMKKTAHSGVFRTPTKEIPCISCKQAFKNIIDYTNHMMTAHTTLSFSKKNNNDSDQID